MGTVPIGYKNAMMGAERSPEGRGSFDACECCRRSYSNQFACFEPFMRTSKKSRKKVFE